MTWRRAFIALAALAGALASGTATVAQQSDWQTLLNNRLMIEKDCEVAFYSGVVERTIEGKQTVIAKAHCKDKRSFDVSRSSQFELFLIKECQPAPVAC
jgi:hypothetical protein